MLLIVPDVDAWKGSDVDEVVFYFHFRIVGLDLSSSLVECRLNATCVALSLGRCIHLNV